MTESRSALSVAEIAAIAAIVVIWGVNNAAAKVATESLPPLLTGALRFGLAAVCLAWFVRPPFPNWRSLVLLVVLGGPIHFGLIYLAFSMANDVSPLSVSLQLWIPMTALFAFLLLGERITVPAVLGMLIAFFGIAWMVLDSHAFMDLPAIMIGVGASVAWALTTVIARRTRAVSPMKMQGLLSMTAFVFLLLGSMTFETGQVAAMQEAPPLAWGAVAFGALISTVIATGLAFWLVQRREAGRVTPYLLLTPVVSILIGWGFMGDVLTVQILTGAALTLLGVTIVALAERGLRAGVAPGAKVRL
ncbi:LOW QUALITY PROTEIN: permease of the drug/metabolite transporter (DMT) superfamily [Brevundimonas abyssalis TAR-001]|uniref:Permease of the drug/metabolite transporter (DMT) superfamily n=2 Tax=Brevundimonas TaxID=41275 RepID=A0A8E0KN53_9CAUL|nr:LOW QUALITY PROTEIN: permease of the drug/metabolite transporter (DMT) superfamily [Brevundimonas abyssalis TAR-001]